MRKTAIITARGGSKRIPHKNVKSFLGKPIIAYSVEAALSSSLFDEVMVSTDDEKIAEVAIRYGASVPFMRSAATSDDFATTAQVLEEVIACYDERGVQNEFACCIYPTAPFVTDAKLKDAFSKLVASAADTLLPVTRFSFPIWRSFRMEGNRVRYNWPEYASERSQDLSPAYQDAGQFYFFRPAVLKSTGLLITENTIGMEVPELEVQDIDSEEDWTLAELKYGYLLQRHAAEARNLQR